MSLNRRARLGFVIVVATTSLLSLPSPARASCDVTWVGGAPAAPTSWHTGANWSTGNVPSSSQAVCLADGDQSHVVVSDATATAASVSGDEALVIDGGTLTLTDGAVESVISHLTLQAAGVIGGAGDLRITATLSVPSGTMKDAGTTTVAASVAPWSMTNLHLLGGRVLRNESAAQVPPFSSLSLHSGGGGSTFENAGTFSLGGPANLESPVDAGAGEATFVNLPDATLTREFGDHTDFIKVTLDNRGTFTAHGALAFVTPNGRLLNSGSFTTDRFVQFDNAFVNNGAFTSVALTLAKGGYTQAAGMTDVFTGSEFSPAIETDDGDGDRSDDQPITISGGTLRGSAALHGDVVHTGGTLEVGNPTDDVSVMWIRGGDYTMGRQARLEIDLRDDNVGPCEAGFDCDMLDVKGLGNPVTATVGGVVSIDRNGFEPLINRSYPIIGGFLAGSSGKFRSITSAGMPAGTRFLTHKPSASSINVRALDVSLSVGDLRIKEGNSGTKNAAFSVRLSKPAVDSETVTVVLKTVDGTAREPGDYIRKSTTVTFAPGDVEEIVSVAVKGDTRRELNETFFVKLSNVNESAFIADGKAKATIVDND